MAERKLSEKTELCLAELRMIRETYGTSTFDEAQRIMNRARLDGERTEKRKRFKWPRDYRKMYDRQKGICPKCEHEMAFIRGAIEIDHFDPMAKGFNDDTNLRVMHASCNSSKGADNVYETARKSGKTVMQLIQEQQGHSPSNQ